MTILFIMDQLRCTISDGQPSHVLANYNHISRQWKSKVSIFILPTWWDFDLKNEFSSIISTCSRNVNDTILLPSLTSVSRKMKIHISKNAKFLYIKYWMIDRYIFHLCVVMKFNHHKIFETHQFMVYTDFSRWLTIFLK